MGLNDTVTSERKHIAFFGVRNAGKSSIVNEFTGQEMAIVSDVKGTTTDPVKKTMELLPLGPVVIIDTPGIDDDGKVGDLRVRSAKRVLEYADIAIIVIDALKGISNYESELIRSIKSKNIPYIIAYNKSELLDKIPSAAENEIYVSAKEKINIKELREMAAHIIKSEKGQRPLVSDIISADDTVVLVVPVDSAAPKGRLILPQQQTIRDIIEHGACAVVTRETELESTLSKLSEKPGLVITDSQVFKKVASVVPEDIRITSFSILFARYKGNLKELVQGARMLDRLKDDDKVLISEACTHHRQCEDIGTVKLPALIRKYTGKNIKFEFTSGMGFAENLSEYTLVIHCGGCMITGREMKYRMEQAEKQGVPITNYGIAIAKMNGIAERCLMPFQNDLN